MNLTVQRSGALYGEVRVPGDKSITHRALLLGALSQGASWIRGYLDSGDSRATLGCLQGLGVAVEQRNAHDLIVHGKGLHGWQEPGRALDCVRSGTTMRLLAGCLAGQSFYSVLDCDTQLSLRPMDRVAEPLRLMGASIWGRQGGRLPPLSILGSPLKSIRYALPVASAQVKSCLILAGLYAHGSTILIEPGPSRDHTERMLRARGVEITSIGLTHTVSGPAETLEAVDTTVPGDFSSAAYFIVAACLVPGSEITLWNVNLNPTRIGLMDVLDRMGAEIVVLNQRDQGGEPVGDLWVRGRALVATDVDGEVVPRMIDEFPILALAATQAVGVTRVRGAQELRVKETDRIATTVQALRALGARIEPLPDGFEIEGPCPLTGAPVDSQGDHRLAMTLAVAGLIAQGETIVQRSECIGDSFPGFEAILDTLIQGVPA